MKKKILCIFTIILTILVGCANPFSEEKTEINSVSDTWRFTINVT